MKYIIVLIVALIPIAYGCVSLSGTGIQCYSCTNCPTPFDTATANKTTCPLASIACAKVSSSSGTRRFCTNACTEGTSNGVTTNCCLGNLCNSAPKLNNAYFKLFAMTVSIIMCFFKL